MTDVVGSKAHALSESVEKLKDLLEFWSCGGTAQDKDEYEYLNETFRQLRQELLAEKSVRELIPRFVRECRNLDEFWSFAKTISVPEVSGIYAGRREYLRREFQPLRDHLEMVVLERTEHAPTDVQVLSALTKIDSEHVYVAWEALTDRRTEDPEGAITSARTLVETVCKHILDDLDVPYGDDEDLPKLYRMVAVALNMAPEQHQEEVFKQILGGCQSVIVGLAGVRNRLGDAHGKSPRHVRPSARHAGLAANLAGAMALFLIETWVARVGAVDAH